MLDYECYEDNIVTDSEFKYYFIGLIAADGHLTREGNGISIALKESDHDFLDMVRKNVTTKQLRYRKDTKSYGISFANPIIKKELTKFIPRGEKSSCLVFPNINDKFTKHYIRGYYDGDGNVNLITRYRITKSAGRRDYPGLRIRFLGNYEFLLAMANKFKELNLVDFIRYPTQRHDCNICYIEYTFKKAKAILEWMYSDCEYYLNRKRRVFNYIVNSDTSKLLEEYKSGKAKYNTRASSDSSFGEGIVSPIGNNG